MHGDLLACLTGTASGAGSSGCTSACASARALFCPQGMYVFYLELVTDMLHLLVYVIFFVIVFTNYGLPLHLVRWASQGAASHDQCPRFCTGRSFVRRECVNGGCIVLIGGRFLVPEAMACSIKWSAFAPWHRSTQHLRVSSCIGVRLKLRCRCGTCTGLSATSAIGSPTSCATGA